MPVDQVFPAGARVGRPGPSTPRESLIDNGGRHPRRRSARLPFAAGWVAAAAAAGLIGYPLVRLAVSLGSHGVSAAWHSPGLGAAAWHTVALACAVTAVAVPLGTAVALLLARPDVPLRRTLRVAALLPLIVPQFVLGYSWAQAYGPAGFSHAVAGVHWPGLFGPPGVAAVLIVDAAPVSYLLVAAGLATRAQPELGHAARTSGASPAAVLATVTLPLLRPVLAAASVIIFVATLESFAVPQVLGAPAGFATVTTRIYADLSLGSDPATFDEALTLALGLVVAAAVVLLPADLVLGPRLRALRTGQPPAARTVRRRRHPAARVGAALLAGYLALAVGVPLLALVAAAITRAVGLSPTPGNWTLANFRGLITPATGQELAHSLELAVLAACLLTALGALVAALQRRRSGRLLASLATAGFVLPGSALAVALLVAYGRWLDGTLTIILLAYLAKLWALGLRPVLGAHDRIAPGERAAARTSGAGPLTVARTVTLPALAPALGAAWLLVFVTALHEVTMSSLLYSTGSQTLAVAVLSSEELGDIGRTAALSVLLTALVLAAVVVAVLLARLSRRYARGR